MKTYATVIFVIVAFIMGYLIAPRNVDLKELQGDIEMIGELLYEIEEKLEEDY